MPLFDPLSCLTIATLFFSFLLSTTVHPSGPLLTCDKHKLSQPLPFSFLAGVRLRFWVTSWLLQVNLLCFPGWYCLAGYHRRDARLLISLAPFCFLSLAPWKQRVLGLGFDSRRPFQHVACHPRCHCHHQQPSLSLSLSYRLLRDRVLGVGLRGSGRGRGGTREMGKSGYEGVTEKINHPPPFA